MSQQEHCSQVRCNNPPAPGKKTCETCLHRFREMYRERRKRNLCVQIGCDKPPMPGLVRCQFHLEQTRKLAGRAKAIRPHRSSLGRQTETVLGHR